MTVAGVGGRTREATRPRQWHAAARPVVGVLVIGLWVVWAVMAWQLEPRSVSAGQLRADLASGKVLTYRVTGEAQPREAWPPSSGGDGWETFDLDRVTDPGRDGTDQQPTGIEYWVDSRFAPTRHFDPDLVVGSSAEDHDPARSQQLVDELVEELRAGGVATLTFPAHSELVDRGAVFWPGWAALVLGLGSVLLHYRPTRVNRWGWLWLVVVPAFGLGLVALAVLELLRPSHVERPRMRGGRAFLLAIALTLLVELAAGEISRASDSLWIP